MSHSPSNPVNVFGSEFSPSEIEAELQAVLRSSAFERSEKLRRFLQFICDLTLRGEGGRINEYLIGAEVFLRGPNYSPSEDSVVRRQAHTLRQKLQEYYSGEGQSNPIRIELPVGRYIPVFRRVKADSPALSVVAELPEVTALAAVANPAPAVAAPIGAVKGATVWALAPWLVAIGLFCALGAGYWAGTRTARPEVGWATLEFWGPWINSGRPAVICYSSPLTTVVKHFEKELPPDTLPKRIPVREAEAGIMRSAFGLREGGALYFMPAINQTKVGEAIAGVQISSVLSRLHVPVRATQSRLVNWENLRGDDMILLGHNEANQWLDPLLAKTPFRLTPTSSESQRGIVNSAPREGEQAVYQIQYASGNHEGDQEYALISMLPGVAATQHLLLINGLNAQATQAAAEYLTSEEKLAELVGRLRKAQPAHSGPWHFQAVLKTEVHDKVPTKSWVVAVRPL
jgi:hypothetical protein